MKSIDLKKIHETPMVVQILLLLMIAIIVIYFGYLLDFSEITDQTAAERKKEEDSKQQYALIVNQNATFAGDLSLLPTLKSTLVDWKKRVITELEFPSLQDEILKLGDTNQLTLSTFSPGAKFKQDAYNVVPVILNTVGTYDQIGMFISQVANMEKMVVIGNYAITRDIDPLAQKTVASMAPLNSNLPFKAEINIDIYEKL